jgi:hypothetical protein
MEKDTIVTLDENDRWYLAEETTQDGKKYFLAVIVDENNEPGDISKIYEEEKENGEYYLTEVIDEKILNYLTAVFIAKANDKLDEISN